MMFATLFRRTCNHKLIVVVVVVVVAVAVVVVVVDDDALLELRMVTVRVSCGRIQKRGLI